MKKNHHLERLKSYVDYLENLANGCLKPLDEANFLDDTIGQIGKNLQRIEQRDKLMLQELSELFEEISLFDLTFKSNHPQIYAGQYQILLKNIQAMLDKLKSLFTTLKKISNQVDQGSKEITCSTQELTDGVITEDSAIQSLNHSANIIHTAINQTAKETRQISILCEQTNEKIERTGKQIVTLSFDISKINDNATSLNTIIQKMTEISKQINLLSFNAQIEAARMGEKGAGFSVIANQMEDLNNMTKQSLKESEEMILQILNPLSNVMENAVEIVAISNDIVVEASNITNSNQKIAKLTIEQSEAAKQIGKNIQNIKKISENNAMTSEELIATAEQFYDLVHSLDELLVFKL